MTNTKTSEGVWRFSLVLPISLYQEVAKIHQQENISATRVIIVALRLLVECYRVIRNGGQVIFETETGKEKYPLIFF